MNSFIQFNSLDFYKLAKIATDQHKTEMVENSGRGVEQQKQKKKSIKNQVQLPQVSCHMSATRVHEMVYASEYMSAR